MYIIYGFEQTSLQFIPLLREDLRVVAEQPLTSLIVSPKPGVLVTVDPELPVPHLLLVVVVDMQDVLVLARLGLHEGRAGLARS